MKKRTSEWCSLGATAVLVGALLACGGTGSEGDFADNGGMSGTGISQGSITSFGSIFVNGVEWDLGGASIEVDGAPALEADLRLGMVVRVQGDFAADGLTGTALSVVFDDSLEGPISTDPVDLSPTEKQLSVLGVSVIADANRTVFDDGASFAGLARDQVIEVSGLVDEAGAVRATRIELIGVFPGANAAELHGTVQNLVPDAMGGGVFDLGSVTVRYTAATTFEAGDAMSLANGQLVEARGTLRVTGTDLDANRIEFEDEGLGDDDRDEVKLEGFVTGFVSDADFLVAGVPVDASGATLDPPTLVLGNGVQVEVEGRFQAGVLVADDVEGEGDDSPDAGEPRVEIDAAASAVSNTPQTITLLGVEVRVDGNTLLEDDRDDLPNFRFSDIAPGDWLEIRAVATGPGEARALRIERDEVEDDVRLRAQVTDFDASPSLEVLDQPVALDAGTLYFDDLGNLRTAEQFFDNPGDLQLGDSVQVTDENAVDPEVLGVADVVEIEDD